MRRLSFGQKNPVARGRRAKALGPRLEALEGRQLLAIFHVTSLGDEATGTGNSGTLRYVMTQANLQSDTDTIDFQLDDADKVDGVWTIQPATPLPAITAPVYLNGVINNSTVPQVVIDGSTMPAGTATDGLAFTATASNSTVASLTIHSFGGAGISGTGLSNLSIKGSYIGTNSTATAAAANGVGVLLTNVSTSTIGGQSTGTSNVISGNTGAGIRIVGSGSQSNNIQGNTIGLNLGGSAAVPNGVGIEFAGDSNGAGGAHDNVIGGNGTAARNTISGNTGAGIRILDTGTSGNQIQNNYIGTGSNGVQAIPNAVGIYFGAGASGNTVGGLASTLRNIISGNTDTGIEIAGAQGTLVAGNYIGTKVDGSAAINGGGQGQAGVLIRDGALNNTVGGTSTFASNLISGNSGPGVWVRGVTSGSGSATGGTLIQGNNIGMNLAGTNAVGNRQGIAVTDGARSTTIGGTLSTAANTISGNTDDGILLASFDTTGAVIQGNVIGLAKDNTTALGNAGSGIRIDGAHDNQIGGTLSGAGNTIASNAKAGVWVQVGDGNTIRRNVIQNNGALGIELGDEGVTPNNPNGGPGGNHLQPYPELTAVTTTNGVTRISGTLHALANQTYILEFFSDPNPDPSGYGEGATYLGTTNVTTGSDGVATFSATASSAVNVGTSVSATATSQNASGQPANTSEFAANLKNSIPQADLVLSQSATTPSTTQPNAVGAGAYITYTLVVRNNGPSTAGGVTVTDTLPTGASFIGGTATTGTIGLTNSGGTVTFNVGDLASGSSATLTITAVAPGTVPSPPTITNTAVAAQSASATDPDPGSNTSTLTTTVLQSVDLAISQLALPSPVSVGTELAFVLTLTNSSSTQAHDVVLTDVLPANFVYTRSVTTQGTVSVADGKLVADLGTLPPVSTTGTGYSARVVILGIPTTAGGLTNSATVTSQEPQVVPGSTSSTLTLAVVPPLADTAATPPHVLGAVRNDSGRYTRQVVIGFDQSLNAISATAIGNYRLISPGRDGSFGTRDDVAIPLRSAEYDRIAQTVTLTPDHVFSARVNTVLTINGTAPSGVTSSTGVLLDGNDDGTPGGDFFRLLPGQTPQANATARPVPHGPRARRAWRGA